MSRAWLLALFLPAFFQSYVSVALESNSSSTPAPSEGSPTPEAAEEVTSMVLELLKGYDKRFRPNFGGKPVNVSVTASIEFIGDISEENMEFTTILYFRQYWTDPRLAFEDKGYKKRLAFNPEMVKSLWVPDAHFPGIKTGFKNKVTATNEVIRVWPNGTVLYSMRLNILSQCLMDLRNFPMDKQKCQLKIEAFSYDDQDMTLNWLNSKPVVLSDGIDIPGYTLQDTQWSSDTEDFTTGRYSLLVIKLGLDRNLGYHLFQTYLPCYLVVILAWVTFWVDREHATARIVMSVTTMVAMVALLVSARVAVPRVSYMKALDLFLFICLLFVFFATLEYVLVSYLMYKIRTEGKDGATCKQSEEKLNEVGEEAGGEGETPEAGERPGSGHEAVWIPEKDQVETKKKGGRKARCCKCPRTCKAGLLNAVEFLARLIFPVFFICLNAAYWFYYTVLAHE